MKLHEHEALPTTLSKEFRNILLGKEIGSGMSRTVYECIANPDLVVKVENGIESFQNIIEWDTWRQVVYTPDEKWFAECVAISPNGQILLQKKVKQEGKYPNKVPNFFSDIKKENFGFIGNQLVACDYGSRLVTRSLGGKLRTVKWD